MLRHKFASQVITLAAMIGLAVMVGQSACRADDDGGTFFDKLDRFGQNIFGGLFPTDRPTDQDEYQAKPMPQPQLQPRLQPPPQRQLQPQPQSQPDLSDSDQNPPNNPPRSGPVNVPYSQQPNYDRVYRPAVQNGDANPALEVPAAMAGNADTLTPEQVPQSRMPLRPIPVRAPAIIVPAENASTPAASPNESVATSPVTSPVTQTSVEPTPALAPVAAPQSPADAPTAGGIRNVPLYQRMSQLRQSPFGTTAPQAAAPQTATPPGIPSQANPTPAAPPEMSLPAEKSGVARQATTPAIPAATSQPTVIVAAPALATPHADPVYMPVLPTPAGPSPASAQPLAARSGGLVPPPLVDGSPSDRSRGNAALPTPARPAAAAGSGAFGGVLLTRQSPNLRVETIGPRRIAVGKVSSYEISMINSGEVPAEELVVTIDLPAWADVQGSEATQGAAQSTTAAAAGRQLLWKVGRLEAKGRQQLLVRIIPRESRPFDLAVKWDYRQTPTQAMIEVQEPKLAVTMEGPREILYGKKEVYRIKVANTGTGDAENVLLRLWPIGSTAAAAASQALGNLAPGEQRTIEAELTARQAGNLTMKIETVCDGNVRAELAEPVLVRRAALQIQAAGPKFQYVGTTGVYRARITNPGTAAAQHIVVQAALPPDIKCQSAGDGGLIDGSAVRWKLDTLAPGSEKTLELKCLLGRAGDLRLEMSAVAEDDLKATTVALTQVEAMADLVLEVTDPTGPVALGDDALYELHIRNRGSKAAEEIEVSAFFSQGIEPISVEGGPHRISVGQVTFAPIPALPAGKEVRLKITARAQTAGTHVFRVEARCQSLSVRLASEETTRFYQPQGANEPATPAINPVLTVPQSAARGAAVQR
jgi:hypothetical protein